MKIKAIVVDTLPKSASECEFAKNRMVMDELSHIFGKQYITFTCEFLGNKTNAILAEMFLEDRCVLCPLINHSNYIVRYGVELRAKDFE